MPQPEANTDSPELFQLRQRKVLPPLAAPPTELSMDTHPLTAMDTEIKSEMETLVRNHVRFARAFKLNDAAMLLPFLDKDVTLTTTDGAVFHGISAVLGCLVGSKLGKLSGALHIKGRPTRSGSWQSAFVYEHGLVFKEPLYSEVVEWKPQSTVITKITHTRLSNPLDAGPPKSVADVVKVVATLPHRLSLSDEDDYPSPQLNRRSSLSSAHVAALNSSQTTEEDTPSSVGGVIVTRVAVLSKLSPIRKRKLVNAFLTVESEAGAVLWRSTVARKQTLPVWSGIELDIPPPLEEGEDSLEKVNNTPVVVTLWDYGFFRSLRVATAVVTAAQLLKAERVGISTLELKPMGLSTQPIELSLSLVRPDNDREWRPRRGSILSTVAAVDAAVSSGDEISTVVTTKRNSCGFMDLDPFAVDGPWLVVAISALSLLFCATAVWLHSWSHVVAE